MKRGQVTLFVILGIIIIALLAGAYYIRTAFVKTTAEKRAIEESSLSIDEIEVKNSVEDCLTDLGEEAILFTAARGGYYEYPRRIEPFNSIAIPYYLYKDEEIVPSINTLEQQIGLYIDAELEECLTARSSQNVIVIEPPSTSAILKDEEIIIETEMPISIGAESERRVSFYTAEIKTNYRQIYNDAIEVYDKLKVIDNFLFVDLSALALNKNYELRNAIEGEKILTLMLYKDTKIKETPLRFSFAILHDSGKRIVKDDIFSKNKLTEIARLIQEISNLREVASEEDYISEEEKYDSGTIIGALQRSPYRRRS